MALTPLNLIAPEGKLQESLFPDGDLTVFVTKWLDQANGKLTGILAVYQDAARTAWVYHRAYSHVADRLAGLPNSSSVDSAAQVSMQIGKDRIAYFTSLANKYLEEFEGYISVPTEGATPRSTWVRNRVIF